VIRHTVVVQHPSLVFPHFRPLSAHSTPQFVTWFISKQSFTEYWKGTASYNEILIPASDVNSNGTVK
jgi:hypothetical protein